MKLKKSIKPRKQHSHKLKDEKWQKTEKDMKSELTLKKLRWVCQKFLEALGMLEFQDKKWGMSYEVSNK